MNPNWSRLTIVTAIACLVPLVSLAADESFHSGQIVLYNQMDEFGERSPSARVLAAYIKQINAQAATLWADQKGQTGKSGLIAVAIRPNRTLKFWVDVDELFQPEITALLEKKMKGVEVPPVKYGPIALAIQFDLWGGSSRAKEVSDKIRIPQSWRKAVETAGKSLTIPNEILPLVWPEETGPLAEGPKTKMVVPEGYVLQELSPTGGRLLRPKDWFYTEGHRGRRLMWTISKEDAKDGHYETGLRIQLFVGVRKGSGKSAQEFVESFVETKKRSAKVISQRPSQTQGLFTRIGIETEETIAEGAAQKTYHILYSCFWSESDLVVITIAGTTPELWGKYSSVFDEMGNFELIDMAKVGEEVNKASHGPAVPQH